MLDINQIGLAYTGEGLQIIEPGVQVPDLDMLLHINGGAQGRGHQWRTGELVAGELCCFLQLLHIHLGLGQQLHIALLGLLLHIACSNIIGIEAKRQDRNGANQ
ncbi:hypothetical protein D3C75_666770 [compost metagenome]